jgi:hypothetical protein
MTELGVRERVLAAHEAVPAAIRQRLARRARCYAAPNTSA